MGTATLGIGGITLTLDGDTSLARALALPGMREFMAVGTEADCIEVRLDRPLALPPYRWLHRFDIADGTAECRFGIDAEGVYHFTFGDSGLLQFDPRQPDTVCLNTIDDPNLLRFAMWTAYAMAGLWRGAVPVHASAVVWRGQAVLCLGESGTGKSTHTHLWTTHFDGAWLLNDDSPIVRLREGRVWAYGSPWSGKSPCFHREGVPVAALIRLEQRPANSIRRLGTIEAFTALHPSCPPALAHDERCTDLMVDFVGGVIGNVPLFRLGCRPDREAAELSRNTIFPET
ncbi:MAG: hypothetical protein IJ524_03540 [Bacteroidales bacterium]|nr:hypothetical protein [Bacteroidales bacterium]